MGEGQTRKFSAVQFTYNGSESGWTPTDAGVRKSLFENAQAGLLECKCGSRDQDTITGNELCDC